MVPLSSPKGENMGCLLWVQSTVFVQLPISMQYHVIQNHIMKEPDTIGIKFTYSMSTRFVCSQTWTHWGIVMPYCAIPTWSSLVQATAYCLFSIKPLLKFNDNLSLILPQEQISVQVELKYSYFHSRKYSGKAYLQNGGSFVQASIG